MAEPSAAGHSFDDEALPHLDALYRVALRLTGGLRQPGQRVVLRE